jgi:hypothetical protein
VLRIGVEFVELAQDAIHTCLRLGVSRIQLTEPRLLQKLLGPLPQKLDLVSLLNLDGTAHQSLKEDTDHLEL